MKLRIVGEDALMVYFGDVVDAQTSARVQAATSAIEYVMGEDLIDLVPSYASVLILYNPLRTNHLSVTRRVRDVLSNVSTPATVECRTVVLPVYYAPEAGIDLESLAERAGLPISKVIQFNSIILSLRDVAISNMLCPSALTPKICFIWLAAIIMPEAVTNPVITG